MHSEISIIDGVSLSNMCDYSFGDQSSIICNIYGGFMKEANENNIEFINVLNEISKTRNYMTLFIDNIRLYNREIILNNGNDQIWINMLMAKNDLLKLCSKFGNMRFIIFTNLEDTPIDDKIETLIPDNVVSINSSNAIFHNEKVIPFPYGVQRKMSPSDNRRQILLENMSIKSDPNRLLYMNHTISTNFYERNGINKNFYNKDWATVDDKRIDYTLFLSKVRDHKFIICPIGNAVDCHRNWEVLYMNRVPVMRKNKYLEYLFKDFPVLFVDNWSDINVDLLFDNTHLYQEVISMDMKKLDLNFRFNKIISEI